MTRPFQHRSAGRTRSVDGKVTFRWKDYRHHDKPKLITLGADEFIRRFLLHTLPDGFHRIRHYGLFASGHRGQTLALCRRLLEAPTTASAIGSSPAVPWICPCCGGSMVSTGPWRDDGALARHLMTATHRPSSSLRPGSAVAPLNSQPAVTSTAITPDHSPPKPLGSGPTALITHNARPPSRGFVQSGFKKVAARATPDPCARDLPEPSRFRVQAG